MKKKILCPWTEIESSGYVFRIVDQVTQDIYVKWLWNITYKFVLHLLVLDLFLSAGFRRQVSNCGCFSWYCQEMKKKLNVRKYKVGVSLPFSSKSGIPLKRLLFKNLLKPCLDELLHFFLNPAKTSGRHFCFRSVTKFSTPVKSSKYIPDYDRVITSY